MWYFFALVSKPVVYSCTTITKNKITKKRKSFNKKILPVKYIYKFTK